MLRYSRAHGNGKLLPENNGYISYGELSSAWRVGRDKNNPQRTKPDAERKGGVIENQTKNKTKWEGNIPKEVRTVGSQWQNSAL